MTNHPADAVCVVVPTEANVVLDLERHAHLTVIDEDGKRVCWLPAATARGPIIATMISNKRSS